MASRKPIIHNAGEQVVIQAADVIDPAALGTGTASSTTVLYGDSTYKTPSATDANAVHLTGNETAAGTKTWSGAAIFNSSLNINGALSHSRVGDATAAQVLVDADTGQIIQFQFRTGTSARWTFGKNGTAEGGANAGSDWFLQAWDDAGASLGNVYSVARATRILTFGATPLVPTATAGDNTTKAASTAFVTRDFAPLVSPQLTGVSRVSRPSIPTQYIEFDPSSPFINMFSAPTNAKVLNFNSTTDAANTAPSVGTCGFTFQVLGVAKMSMTTAGGSLTGVWTGATATAGTNTTQLATTAFVTAAVGSASGGYTVSTRTASYTETNVSGNVITKCDLAAGFIITLPTAVGNTAMLTYKKMQSGGKIEIDANGAQTIDGALNLFLTDQYESVTLISDGANWSII